MAMTDLFNAADIKKAVEAFSAQDSFNHQKFFEMVGMKRKTPEERKKIFGLLDKSERGYVDEEELPSLLRNFSPGGRSLTAAETKAMMAAGDKDGDGKIGIDDFLTMMAEL
ncbi:parvalbumin, muscle-like [Elgaria multicarinata webbii]|uniref:parvalbumin, muscle-like n=1 Tax=Elgaria multicarinata webbii TaxID=159646 RepID=UPI002FCD13C4